MMSLLLFCARELGSVDSFSMCILKPNEKCKTILCESLSWLTFDNLAKYVISLLGIRICGQHQIKTLTCDLDS